MLMLVIASIAGPAAAQLEPTTSTGIGVWYRSGAPAEKNLWQDGDPGERLILRIVVRDTNGAPVPDAQVEMWQADGAGQTHAERYRTLLRTAADGSIDISTVLPGYIWRARHIHLLVTHPAHPTLITRVLFRGDPLLADMEYPELEIALDEGKIGEDSALFGTVEIVLGK